MKRLEGMVRGPGTTSDGGGGGDDRVVGRPVGGLSRRQFVRLGLGAVAPPLLGACLYQPTQPTDQQQGNARLTVRPHPPTESIPLGESKLGLDPIGADGFLYVPSTYDPAVPAPLFVALHGAGRTADDWQGFYPGCESRGIILLSIESRSRTWDRVSGYFGRDVLFIDDALAYAFDHCAIDPARVALGGISDGASYALSLGPCNGDLFPFLIAFSPGHSEPNEHLVGKPKIFISHGTEDEILPIDVTSRRIVPTLRAAGYEVTYVEFKGGHEIPPDIGGSALDWLLTESAPAG